jgi:Mg2+-importing ATPase
VVSLASQLRSPPRRGSDDSGNRMIITKGAPEGLLERCTGIPAAERTAVEAEFAAGTRVILRR